MKINKTIYCGLFQDNVTFYKDLDDVRGILKKNICRRDGKLCGAYNKNKEIRCYAIKSQLNNLDKFLLKSGRLKLKVERSGLYSTKYYE